MQFFGIPVLGKFVPKNQKCQFNLKFGTKPKSNMHDSVYVIVFYFGLETPFLEKFDLKIQNCLKWNLMVSVRIIWKCRIHWWCSLFSFLTGPKNETDSLSWNLVLSLIQICRAQWWCLFYLFLTGSILFWKICFKKWNCLLRLKFITWTNSNMQNSMVLFSFYFLGWKDPFWVKNGPKVQNCQFKWKYCS